MIRLREGADGFVLVTVLLTMALFSLLAMTYLSVSYAEIKISQTHADTAGAFNVAEAGLDAARAQLQYDPLWRAGFAATSFGQGAYEVSLDESTGQPRITSTGTVGRAQQRISTVVDWDNPWVGKFSLYTGNYFRSEGSIKIEGASVYCESIDVPNRLDITAPLPPLIVGERPAAGSRFSNLDLTDSHSGDHYKVKNMADWAQAEADGFIAVEDRTFPLDDYVIPPYYEELTFAQGELSGPGQLLDPDFTSGSSVFYIDTSEPGNSQPLEVEYTDETGEYDEVRQVLEVGGDALGTGTIVVDGDVLLRTMRRSAPEERILLIVFGDIWMEGQLGGPQEHQRLTAYIIGDGNFYLNKPGNTKVFLKGGLIIRGNIGCPTNYFNNMDLLSDPLEMRVPPGIPGLRVLNEGWQHQSID